MSRELTIVVPAFKGAALAETLHSIASQTRKDFRLLVVDDASPDPIAGIAARFPGVEYHRFDANLGGRDLVGHWNRCVSLADTKYVWLFSDDDVMDPTCVEAFLEAATKYPEHDVYRFDTRVEDLAAGTIEDNPQHPEAESGRDFLLAKILNRRRSYMPEHVFRRERFLAGGASFVRFPLAWNSDDASWVHLADERPIRTVAGPRVTWRYGGGNISSSRGNSLAKATADLEFTLWAQGRMSIPRGALEHLRAHRIRHHYAWEWSHLRRAQWWRLLVASRASTALSLVWSTLLDIDLRSRAKLRVRRLLRPGG